MGTYSFINIVAVLSGPGGNFQLGYGSGNAKEGLTFEMLDDKDKMDVGADGSIMHSLRASDAGKATVRLLKTAPTNRALSQLYNFQKSSSIFWGQNLLRVQDVVRGDVIACEDLAFARQAPVTYGEDGETMEWTFFGRIPAMLLGSGVPNLNV